MTSLRVLVDSDFQSVWTIFHSVFEHKYIREFQDVWKARNPPLSFGLFDDQQILVGFLLTKQLTETHQQVEFIGVSPTIQKGGVGTRLLRCLLDDSLQRSYTVTLIPVNDERIIGWYTKLGFQAYGKPRLSPYTGEMEQTMRYTHIQSSRNA